MVGCYSNNCPVENIVACNYYFYDSEGTPISYSDAITVKTLLPGGVTKYVYRHQGNTIMSDTVRHDLIEAGYTERVQILRNDTTLVNQASNKTFLSIQMSYYNQVDTLIFSYRSISSADTILVEHDSYAHMDLPECGSFRYHKLKTIKSTDAAIDHVEISNPIVNYDGAENIKIYFNGVVEE